METTTTSHFYISLAKFWPHSIQPSSRRHCWRLSAAVVVWSNCRTAGIAFVSCQQQEISSGNCRGLYTIFIDLTKAFDTASRQGLWKLLQKCGSQNKFPKTVLTFMMDCLARSQTMEISPTLSLLLPERSMDKARLRDCMLLFFKHSHVGWSRKGIRCWNKMRFRISNKLVSMSILRSYKRFKSSRAPGRAFSQPHVSIGSTRSSAATLFCLKTTRQSCSNWQRYSAVTIKPALPMTNHKKESWKQYGIKFKSNLCKVSCI